LDHLVDTGTSAYLELVDEFFYLGDMIPCDGVLREVIRWTMCKSGVEKWLVSTDMSMYNGVKQF